MNSQSVSFDLKVFSLNAIKHAAYKYLHVFAVDITVVDEQIQCVIHFASSVDEQKSQLIVNDFRKEALDQDLREKLKAETETVRNLILAHAFSKTGLVSQ